MIRCRKLLCMFARQYLAAVTIWLSVASQACWASPNTEYPPGSTHDLVKHTAGMKPATVPESATLSLAGMGLAELSAMRRSYLAKATIAA